MNWIEPSVLSTCIGTTIVSLTYLYIYLSERKSFLLLWAASWGLYSIRLGLMLVYLTYKTPALLIANQSLALWSAVFLFMGTIAFIGNLRRHSWVIVLALVINVWIAISILVQAPFMYMALPAFTFSGLVYVLAGVALIRNIRGCHFERLLSGWIFIIWGIHKIDYPFLRPVEWFAPWGYLIGAVLAILAAIAILLLYLKISKESLSESEERFRALFAAVSDPVLVADRNTGILVECNDAAVRYLGRSRDQLIGLPQRELHPPQTPMAEGVTEDFKRHVTDPNNREEVLLLTHGGEVRCAEVSAATFEIGESHLILGVFRDITDRMKTEEALKKSDERFQLAMEASQDGLFDWDLVTNEIYYSPGWKSMLGYQYEELPNDFSVWEKSTAPEDVNRSWAMLQELINKQKDRFELEFKMKHKDGHWVDILSRATAIFDDDGTAVRVVGTHVDITERKKTEEALKASEQQFRGLLENVDMVAVQGYDIERKVIFWNAASERLYGYSAEEAFGRKLEDLIIPGPMRSEVVGLVTDWIENDNAIPPGELELLRKDGSLVPVHSAHVKQEDSQGNWEMYCIDVELTDIRKAHDQLLKAKEAAEAANMAKSDFLANMSHEIRTPMNGIIGMLQLLQATELDNEQKEYSLMAIQSSKRLTRLLSDILDLSRVEANRLDIRSDPFDLFVALGQTVELFKPTAEQSGIHLSLDIHPEVQRMVLGDLARLQQVLVNIIGNALKFTHLGQVLVAVYPLPAIENEQARVLFSISDTGCGISDDEVDKLFMPFTQGSEGYTRTHQGAGLGLSICKRLIELMGGNISVESEVDKGTAVHFTITFLQDAKPSSIGEIAKVDTSLMGSTGKILLAEDDQVSSMIVVKQMEKMGFEVTAVEDGRQVLEALRKESFDLILMDVQMPFMDGVETTRGIRAGDAGEKNKDIFIVAITAYAMKGERELFLEAGMDDYLSKPVDMDELKQAIGRGMGGG